MQYYPFNDGFISKSFKTVLLVSFILFFSGCGEKQEIQFSGKTMGTIYHITVVAGYFNSSAGLQPAIDRRLEAINQSMSTYRKDSEISRFNAFERIGEKFAVSDDFWQVMTVARKIYELTEGAWDGTVRPLVNLWGFYRAKNIPEIPGQAEIQAQLAHVGFNHIEISADRHLVKHQLKISLDLASIAKGYGVDQVAALIREKGFENFLVEIGGEVFASGFRKDGQPWRVGINRPQKDAPFDQVYKVLSLSGKALATSGDYRNFFEINGKRFSHVLDPRNGYPLTNGVVSVSIVAETCTFADGLATAVMVMGPARGLELVNRLAGVEGLIIVQDSDGRLADYYSQGFKLQD
ncbi:MAG: FAD:protein FMN transferase [Proteobacteria bacterium]|nr:FAD:protein FMN transferase [Pseudomonadota bacterium]